MLNSLFGLLLGGLGFAALNQFQIFVYAALVAVLLILCAVIIILNVKRSKDTDEVDDTSSAQAATAEELLIVEEVVEEAQSVEEAVEEQPVEEVVEEAQPVEEQVEEVVAEEEQPVEQQPVVEQQQPVVREVAPDVVRRGSVLVRYNKSFTAKLIQADDELRDYYDELKCELLSYKGVKSRISWKHEAFRKGRVVVAKLKIRGKHVTLYLPLNAADYVDTKYKVDDVSNRKSNADTPCAYAIKNDRRCRYAKELIEVVMNRHELEQQEVAPVKYTDDYPYDTTEHLIERELIKLVYSKVGAQGEELVITEEEVQAIIAQEEPVAEEQPVEEPVEQQPVEEQPDEEEPQQEVVEEAEEQPIEEVVEEEPQEEPVEEQVEEVAEDVVDEPIRVVAAEEVSNLMTDEQAQQSVEKGTRYADKTKASIINVDTLAKYFNAGETVTLDEIRKRIPGYKKVTYIKVLARGIIDKPLTVEADEYSLDAIKMIALTGGTVVRTLKK